jgi:hypothetical protein
MNYNMMDEFLSHKLPISLCWKTGKPNDASCIIPTTHFLKIFVGITTE